MAWISTSTNHCFYAPGTKYIYFGGEPIYFEHFSGQSSFLHPCLFFLFLIKSQKMMENNLVTICGKYRNQCIIDSISYVYIAIGDFTDPSLGKLSRYMIDT